MNIRQLTPIIGAEVFGLDISKECSSEQIAEIRAMLLRFGVLVFRGQESLTRESHIAFARRFGAIEVFGRGEPTHPEVIRIVHDQNAPPTENVWHSDMSFRLDPPLGSLLRAMILPPVGGDTLFADMREAWTRLPEGIRALARQLTAEHDIAKHAPPEAGPQLREVSPPVQQPVVREHPETGEELLYVNPAYTTKVLQLSDNDSAALLAHLFRQVTVPEIQCRVRWEAGTVAFWDNRSLQHYAVGDYLPARRVMERVTVGGDQVIPATTIAS